MDISELQRIYAGHPNTKGLAALLEDSSVRTIFLGDYMLLRQLYLFPPFLERINRHLYLYWVTWRKRVTFIMT